MSILDGHNTPTICYTKSMQEIDETAFPPIPPPPPMPAEQRDMAEASICAAIAREAERHAEERQAAERDAQIMAAEECCAFELTPHAKRHSALFSRRRKAALPVIDLPENKPRKPNLQAANLSFAARVIIWVRDRYANNAPAIYKAAYLSRKTYSAIISDENHVVSKRTAIQLAFGLRLSREEADLLLHAAGYHLSRSVVEDMIFDACLEAKIHNLEDVNRFLIAYECRPFVPQE